MKPLNAPAGSGRPGRRLLAGLVLLLLAAPARGGEGAAVLADDAVVRAALASFDAAWKAKDSARRVAAVDGLGGVDHPRVAQRLLKVLKKTDEAPVLSSLFAALEGQRASYPAVGKAVWAWLLAAAESEEKRLARGEPDVRIDPKTGEPDLDSAEGQARLAETRARGEVAAAALRCARTVLAEAPARPAAIAVFLQDPHDDLVIETLRALGAWKASPALPRLLELYRIYPEKFRYETGDVVHPGGTDASAKAEWIVHFGHPDKRRVRPDVVDALALALESLTGRTFEAPEVLATFLARSER